ncbi:hypothetical protein C2845_PM04G25070 [Panicum miliaceum]|uniref:MATH domain-containing protein n=1 Tax=Panicum miliaceum TaxID=4540 RepID=A0A3L6QVP1_PANMI|nr:hypothetical protein C2845_PM04G25070 [Panicum miliaceum]
MGNSCAKGSEHKTFKWTIDGFSSLLDKGAGWTCSSVFEFMRVNWCLKLNPKDRKRNDKKEHVSLKLKLMRTSVKPDTVIEASFKFLIYDQSFGKHREHLGNHSFQAASTTSGTSCMIPLKKLKTSGFLVNNSCTFGIEFIKVATVKTSAPLETLFVTKMNVFNEAKVYTWEIQDYFALKNPSYSPEFEVGRYRWFITVCPTSDGNHLSLYLKMKRPNDLPKDSGNLVEFTLSIMDLENGKDKRSTGRYQFSNNVTYWGWRKFISLEDFKDASNGYLIKGKCCVEAKVAVVGPSKTE